MKKLFTNLIHWKVNQSLIPLMFFLLLTSSFTFAQVKISGTITDANGQTLPGVNIGIQGTKNAVASDDQGRYAIDVPANSTLTISYIGYVTQFVSISGKSTIDIKLKESSEALDEVVINVGYGTQKRADVNSSISNIQAKDLQDVPLVSMDKMMQGRASGVLVTNNTGQPGSSVSVKIRGATSIGGTNEPLYIIDGVPISGDATYQSTSGRPLAAGYSNGNPNGVTVSPLAMLNPNDIERIDILKDAAATAIYGSRGANGVVVVTTKSGKKGTGKLVYDSYIAVETQAKLLEPMNLQQYATQQNALSEVYGYGLRPEFVDPSLLGPGTNWQDEIYQTGILTSHQLSFSGGKEGVNYFISGGAVDQEGTVIGSDYRRYNFRTNLTASVNSWLNVGVNLSAATSNENITLNGGQNGIISTSLLSTPDVAVKNLDGSYSGPPPGGSQGSFINPVAQALLNTNNLIRRNFNGNFFADISFTKHLVYRFELGGNAEFTNNAQFFPTYVWGSAKNETAEYTTRSQNSNSYNVKNLLTYINTFGKSNLNVLVGQEANDNQWYGDYYTVKDFVSNSIQQIHLGDQETLVGGDYKGSGSLYSFFTRVIYEFDNKYGMSASWRADGSSKFADGKQWGYFPSVALSWKLSNENFMESTRKYIDNIKLRGSYGKTGNQNAPGGLYSSGLTTWPTFAGNGFGVSNIANPNLTWETSTQTDFGLEFTLFNSKLTTTIDIYRKKSEGFLASLPLPGYLTGYASWAGGVNAPYSNVGSMQNQGIDLSVNYSQNFTKDFSWNSTLIWSKNQNELVSINNGINLIKQTNLNDYTVAMVTNTVVGQPIGQFYGYQSLGIITTQEQLDNAAVPQTGNSPAPSSLGDIEYRDQNGDGIINEKDIVAIGNPQPSFNYGFNNTFKYKNIDFTVFLQGTQGNKIYNLTRRTGTMNASLYQNQLAEAADFYTPDNPDAEYPRPVAGIGHANLLLSDRFVEDGSYLRIQTVTLGYNLPLKTISELKLTRLRLHVGIQNLYTFTKYSGYDPEIGASNQDVLLTGIDNGRYPSPRTFTMGLNVEF